MRQLKRPVLIVLLLGLCAGIVSSCTYTYIPPVPRGRVEPEATLDLHASAGIVTETVSGSERLALQLTASNVPEADWLAVQWFAPDNQQVASASQWLEPSRQPQDLRFVLSGDIPLRPGDWRAVVSYQSRVARQFSLPLVADVETNTETDADTGADTDSGTDTSTDTSTDTGTDTSMDTAAEDTEADNELETPEDTLPEAPSLETPPSQTPRPSPATPD